MKRLLLCALGCAATAAAANLLIAAHARNGFPHESHAGLFPVCIGCHLGIATGAAQQNYPEPDDCATCHDGQRAELVEWSGPSPEVDNLRFEHRAHASHLAAAEAEELDCGDCHTQRDTPRMRVEPPIPSRCFDCHEHAATEHLVDADCATCHRPLVETAFPPSRIAALPVPPSHRRADFLESAHGELAAAAPESCATCHAREQCSGCHVAFATASPADRVPLAAGRIEVPPIAARYPLPESHLDPDWERLHGRAAASAACGTCHTRDSCSSCHLAPLPAAVAQLPRASEVAAPGAAVARTAPASHASAFFATMHGPLASARPQSCTSCHERARFCGACHQAGDAAGTAPAEVRQPPTAAVDTPPAPRRAAEPRRTGRGFHPPDFTLRHTAIAYGRRLDCSSCHSTQLFCRDCHTRAGMGSAGRLGPGYHDAEPIWLLRHGQAARQTLESCTSCHTQRDCMQCHSQLGAFRVNPHGPGFDARRAHRTNPQICRACHIGDPFGGG